MNQKLERGIKEIVLSVNNDLNLKMKGKDHSQDPDIIPERGMMDMTIDQDLTDLNLLEEEESWTGVINHKPIQDSIFFAMYRV